MRFKIDELSLGHVIMAKKVPRKFRIKIAQISFWPRNVNVFGVLETQTPEQRSGILLKKNGLFKMAQKRCSRNMSTENDQIKCPRNMSKKLNRLAKFL